jgi:hypothetical protein
MRIKVLFFLMIFICYCGRKSTNETGNAGSVIAIDLLSEPVSTVKKLSEFAANIEYKPLQTTESSLMDGFTRKIVSIDKRLYIQNREGIMCFNMVGKFLFKLENRGRGPEEYTYLIDFDVSSDNKSLTILSNSKLLIYGISDTGFTFQRSLTLKDPAPYRVSMVPETNNAFMSIAPWIGTEPTLSLLINTSGDTIYYKPNCYKYKMSGKTNFRATNEMLAYSVGNMVCFKEKISDTVFYVDAKTNVFKPRMIFDSHGTTLTPEMRGGSETPGKNTTFIPYISETSRYVFYWYFTMQSLNGILFDKTTTTKHKLDVQKDLKISLPDDLSGGPDFNIEYVNKSFCSGGNLFSFVEAITLKRYVESDAFKNAHTSDPKKKKDLKKLADSLKETDNPVLIVVTPRK